MSTTMRPSLQIVIPIIRIYPHMFEGKLNNLPKTEHRLPSGQKDVDTTLKRRQTSVETTL